MALIEGGISCTRSSAPWSRLTAQTGQDAQSSDSESSDSEGLGTPTDDYGEGSSDTDSQRGGASRWRPSYPTLTADQTSLPSQSASSSPIESTFASQATIDQTGLESSAPDASSRAVSSPTPAGSRPTNYSNLHGQASIGAILSNLLSSPTPDHIQSTSELRATQYVWSHSNAAYRKPEDPTVYSPGTETSFAVSQSPPAASPVSPDAHDSRQTYSKLFTDDSQITYGSSTIG